MRLLYGFWGIYAVGVAIAVFSGYQPSQFATGLYMLGAGLVMIGRALEDNK